MAVAVICAMDWELAHLRQALPDSREDWHDGHRAYLSTSGTQRLVLAECGMGMVSAAAHTQAVISRYMPRAVVNYGCAGAHRSDLLPGDLVVATHLVAYDNLVETSEGQLRYRGMRYLLAGQQQRIDVLPVDPLLLVAARRAAEALADRHEPWPLELGWPEDLAHRPPRAFFGTVASGDGWHRSAASIAALVSRHHSLCEDMEAAAIGLVCAGEGVPFISVKDISNNELLHSTQSAHAMVSGIGVDQIARRAAAFVLALLDLIQ